MDVHTAVNRCIERFASAGEIDKAVKVFEDAITSMDRIYLNERLKCEMYLVILCNLSICHGESGRHQEAEQICVITL